ncbi:MAG: lipoate--protein ligase family protein [Actinomycetota bacterium]|nr:lipoate--protein ligase family protein [Actinomycetota bacterium]
MQGKAQLRGAWRRRGWHLAPGEPQRLEPLDACERKAVHRSAWLALGERVTVPPSLRLVREGFPERPAYDTAVSRALMLRVAEGREPETFRLHRPGATLAFGRRDASRPGYPTAVTAATAAGFAAVQRLAGGQAAVFHQETLAFSHEVADPAPRRGIHERFCVISDVMSAALRRLGVDARVGEVAGEYCGGAYSVNARGIRKLVGVGQRIITGAAHVGGVVVVAGSDRVRHVLVPVYAALEIPWQPVTVGSVEDEIGPLSAEVVAEAIIDELDLRYDLVEGQLNRDTLELGEALEADHCVHRTMHHCAHDAVSRTSVESPRQVRKDGGPLASAADRNWRV